MTAKPELWWRAYWTGRSPFDRGSTGLGQEVVSSNSSEAVEFRYETTAGGAKRITALSPVRELALQGIEAELQRMRTIVIVRGLREALMTQLHDIAELKDGNLWLNVDGGKALLQLGFVATAIDSAIRATR